MNGHVFKKLGLHKTCMLICCLLLLVPQMMQAQQTKEISGTVKDENGATILGATVSVAGTNKTAITDNNGKFSISAPDNSVLKVSFIGYETNQTKVAGRQNLSITLKEDANGLNEIVVVGYGTQKKVHVTGSVSQVTSKELMKAPMMNVSQMMEGKLPGLTTVESSGQPGLNNVSMLVRGSGTYSSNGGSSPLYIVDGVERAFGNIDPNDVETISILKDAAAGAVYGVKAGQGVIMITTKRGSQTGKPNVTYSGNYTLSECTRLPEFLNGTEYIDWYSKAQDMDGVTRTFSDAFRAKVIDGDTSDGIEDTDWMDLILQKIAPTQQHNVSINGATDNVKYFVSAGYMDQDGIVKDLNFKRENVRSNLDVKVTDRLSIELNLAARNEDSYIPGSSDFGIQNNNSALYQAMVANPFICPTRNNGATLTGAGAGTYNPPAFLEKSGFQKTNNMILESSAALKYKVPGIKGLVAKLFGSFDWKYSGNRKYACAFSIDKFNNPTATAPFGSWATTNYFGQTVGGNLFDGDQKNRQAMLRPSLEYTKKIGKSDLSALLLYEQTEENIRSLSGTKKTFAVNDIIELNMGQTYTAAAQGTSSSTAVAGYVGRINYAYDSKYLFEMVCRRDGSYKFPSKSRWGTFPSVSAGWVVSKENFFNSLFPKVDLLKLRASAGILGRDNVNEFLYNTYYSYMGTTPSIVLGTTPYYALKTVNSYPSSNLTWEKTKSYNVGFDLSAWNGLLGLEFDAFYKYTYDILQSVGGSYPSSLGGYYPSIENSGSVDVKGYELSLSHRNTIGEFTYSLSGNISYAKNRILSRIQTEGLCAWQNVLGTSTGTPVGYISKGLFQTQEELNNFSYMTSNRYVGNIGFKDLNGDGQINNQDRTFTGKPLTPNTYFGFSGNCSYKGFDFNMNWQGATGNTVQLGGLYDNGFEDNTLATKAFYSSRNSSKYVVENSWTPEHTNSLFPRLSVTHSVSDGNGSTYWCKDGSYLRLKSATIGYTIPSYVDKMLGVQNIRIFTAGTNLLTFTALKYFDPEAPSVTNSYYPQQRTYSFGVNVTF